VKVDLAQLQDKLAYFRKFETASLRQFVPVLSDDLEVLLDAAEALEGLMIVIDKLVTQAGELKGLAEGDEHWTAFWDATDAANDSLSGIKKSC
jgi:hypothetical protein